MAIALDATSTCAVNGPGAVSISWTHTPVGTPTLVTIGFTNRGGGTSNMSFTYGGQTASPVTSASTGDAGTEVRLFALGNPPSGPQTVSGTWTTGINVGIGEARTFTGTRLVSPVANGANSGGIVGGTSGTLTVSNVGPTDMVIDHWQHAVLEGMTPGADQTENYERGTGPIGGNSTEDAGSTQPGTAGGVMTYSWVTDTAYAGCGLRIIAGGAGSRVVWIL